MFLFNDKDNVYKGFKVITLTFLLILITAIILLPISTLIYINFKIVGDVVFASFFLFFLLWFYFIMNLKTIEATKNNRYLLEIGKCKKNYCDYGFSPCILNDNSGIWICPNYQFENRKDIIDIIDNILDNKID